MKLIRKLPTLSTRAKLLRNVAIMLVALLLFYLFMGAPTFSDEALFRRKERQNMVGPSNILAIIEMQDIAFSRLLIAESNYGYILMPIFSRRQTTEGLYYNEKSDGIDIMVMPNEVFRWSTNRRPPSIIAFDNTLNAVRAELDLLIHYEEDISLFERDYTLLSERVHNGFFIFNLPPALGEFTDRAYRFFERLADHTNYNDFSFPATIRLYDAAGSLIYEQEMELS